MIGRLFGSGLISPYVSESIGLSSNSVYRSVHRPLGGGIDGTVSPGLRYSISQSVLSPRKVC